MAFGQGIALDRQGNIHSVGHFHGKVDFDPDSSLFLLNTFDGMDGYIQKLDIDRNLLWVKQICGPWSQSCGQVKLDSDGNVYVLGHFELTSDFDLGPDTFNLTAINDEDIFVLKLNPNGNFV
jgi:hypothetical protein